MCSIMGYCGSGVDLNKFKAGFARTASSGPDASRIVDVGGGVLVHKRLLALAIPFVVCVAIYILIPDLYETFEGFVIILCIPAIYFFTKKLYKKGVITVELPEDKDAAPAQEELQ